MEAVLSAAAVREVVLEGEGNGAKRDFVPRDFLLAEKAQLEGFGAGSEVKIQQLGAVDDMHLLEAAGGAHGIALGWEALGYLSGAAFGTAATALVGLNLGAGQPNEASRCAWTAYGLGAVFMSIMGGLFFIFAESMFLVFCPDPSQGEIVRIGAPVLRLIAFAMPFLRNISLALSIF